MTRKNAEKMERKARRMASGTFIGCRPSRQRPKTAYSRKGRRKGPLAA